MLGLVIGRKSGTEELNAEVLNVIIITNIYTTDFNQIYPPLAAVCLMQNS